MASWCSPRRRPGGYGGKSSASNDGVFLPSELLREILLRVPSAKTLCRLRAVSRSWRSLLSDPLFVAAHGASHPGPLFAVFMIRSRSSPGSRNSCIDLMDTSGDVVKRVRVAEGMSFKPRVQQRAGMVLIAGDASERLRVLDPATGAVSLLPSVRAYDSVVLGQANTTGGGDGEYKVVVLTGAARPRTTVQSCKVLTFGDGAWREAPVPPVNVSQFSRSAAVVNGVIYYLADLTSDRPWSSIAAFDIKAERWLPDLLRSPGATVPHSLAEVDGRLAAIYNSVFSVDLWQLMGSGEDGQQQALWCKKFTVRRSCIAPQSWQRFSPQLLWVMDDGRVVFFVNSYIQAAALGMYDPRTETWTEVAQLEDCVELLGAGVYTGNLLRVQREQGMVS